MKQIYVVGASLCKIAASLDKTVEMRAKTVHVYLKLNKNWNFNDGKKK